MAGKTAGKKGKELMLRVGIITFHFPYNAGAVLQCYALQTYLKRIGCEVNIINYKPWYHQNMYTPFRNPIQASKEEFKRSKKDGLGKKAGFRAFRYFLATLKSWTRYKEVIECEKKFKDFRKKKLYETKCYRTLKQLKQKPPQCDVYVCGSDQIWNTSLTGGDYDYAYFLEFGEQTVRKLSYAVGMSKFPKQDARAGKCLLEFDALSVREEDNFKDAQELYGEKIPVQVDVDPTLLLDRGDYEAMLPLTALEKNPFILTYVLPDASGHVVLQEAEKLAKKLGIKVINICGKVYEEMYDTSKVRRCGPEEFLWYIAHADYVLTNSFHGTVFSILFHKKFLTVPHTKTGNRVLHLLDKLQIKERALESDTDAVTAILSTIEYKQTDALVKKYSDISKRHLEKWIYKEK